MIGERICYAVIYFAEAVIANLYYGYIYTAKRKRLSVFASFAVGYLLLYVFSFFSNTTLNMSAFFVINTAVLLFCYECKLLSGVFHAAFLTLSMVATEILTNLLITSVLDNYIAYTYNLAVLISLSVISKILYLFIALLTSRMLTPRKLETNEPTLIFLLTTMPLMSAFILLVLGYIWISGRFDYVSEILTAISTLALLLLNVIVIAIYNRVQTLDDENMRLQIGNLKDKADAEYYSMLQTQYENQRVLIHDIKNHLGTISSLAKDNRSDSIADYVSELFLLPELQGKSRLCNNPILNSILLRFDYICKEQGISFECDIRADSVSFMDATSITSLFGNLLSNAVEAAKKSENKAIELSATRQESVVIISVVNSCQSAPQKDNLGNLITTKASAHLHGYGMKSIHRVIRKYDGASTLYYDEKEKQFHVLIHFPIVE